MGVYMSLLQPPTRLWQLVRETYPPSPKWSADEIPDMTGKVVIVTGANAGLGFECARILVSHGAKVYATARTHQKGMAAVELINSQLAASGTTKGGQAVFLPLDLDDLKSIRSAVEEFKSKETRLDVLINNAGIMMPPEGTTNSTGIDPQFATNVLGPFVLTRLLLPTLIHAAETSDDARVVTISSSAHGASRSGGIRFDDLAGGSVFQRYAQSKFGNLVFTQELARKYTESGVISTAVSPGNIKTELWKHQTSFLTPNTLFHKYPISYGVLTHLYAATSPQVTRADSGRYFIPWARRGQALRDDVHDPVLGAKLWEWCEDQMKKEGFTTSS